MKASVELLTAIAVTAELTGRTFTEPAARVFADDLAEYDEQAVIKALGRCRKEVKGFLALADVVSRIDDGRPGADEAWAMIPHDESGSVVWTEEMAQAYGIASPLIGEDMVAARMAFKDAYSRITANAKSEGVAVRWLPSLGSDSGTREAALQIAVDKGRLRRETVQHLLPAPKLDPSMLLLGTESRPTERARAMAFLSDLKAISKART